MKKQRIVLPTDFSKNAWNATVYALVLFRDVPCDFFIVNAFQVGASGLSTKMGMANDTRLFTLMKEESERELDRMLDKIKKLDDNPEHTFTTLSIADTLVNAIGMTVYNKGVDYIVMGTKGASGLKEVFMGSNTYKVINEIDFCPIIAVPDEYDMKDSVETILLATGFEHRFESYEIKPLMRIANHFGSKLKIIHVENSAGLDSKQEASKKLLEKQLKSIPHEFLEEERDASISHTIQTIIEKDPSIAMLVMINHDRTFFERLTRESVIKKISFNTKVPFLVIHLFE